MSRKNDKYRPNGNAQHPANNGPQGTPPINVVHNEPSGGGAADKDHGKITQKAKPIPWDRWFSILSLIFDFGLLVSAIAGWYYLDQQLHMTELSNQVATHALEESRKANDLYRQELQISNRAWVAVQETTLIGNLDSDPLIVSIEMVNTGQVPAERVSFKVDRVYQHQQAKIDAPEPSPAVGSLAPGQKYMSRSIFPKLTPAELDAIKNGTVTLMFRGTVTFLDHFANRELHFCYKWDKGFSMFVVCQETDEESHAHHPGRKK